MKPEEPTIAKTTPVANFRALLACADECYAGRDMLRWKTASGGVAGITPARFAADVDALGSALLALGLAGRHIALIGPTSCEWLLAYFSVTCHVGVIVPLDKDLAQPELAAILLDSDAACIIYADEYASDFEAVRSQLPASTLFLSLSPAARPALGENLSALLERGRKMDASFQPVDESALSVLLYTSGTTGKSKGVMLSQKNILSAVRGGLGMLRVGPTCLSVLPVHHSYECTHGILMMIANGTTICISDSLRYFAENLRLFQPHAIFLVPAFVERLAWLIRKNEQGLGKAHLLQSLLDDGPPNTKYSSSTDDILQDISELLGGRLSLLLCGGAPLATHWMKTFREMGILLLVGYGITECSPLVAVNGNDCFRDGSVGQPISCNIVEIRSVDEDGEGEIWVKGDNVMLGYYKNDTLTQEVVQEGWFNTGDIGHVDKDGFLYITGRKKNLIVLTNGKNVYPEELEEVIQQHLPHVKEAVVYSPPGQSANEKQIIAEVFLEEEYSQKHTVDETRDWLEKNLITINSMLAPYKRIDHFIVRDKAFEKTTKNTIKRFVL